MFKKNNNFIFVLVSDRELHLLDNLPYLSWIHR